MAAAVYEAIESGGTLIAEAGTGTGKTFAYLVPALIAGGKVLISSGTKPLQDQLFRKDLPAVLGALRLNAVTALLKGRSNYVCLHRMARLAMSAGPPQDYRVPNGTGQGVQRPGAYTSQSEGLLPTREDVVHLRSVVRFASMTSTGDCAELASVPENAAIWPLVTSTRDNCLGAECPRFAECFVYKARREAQAADIVVVNHHLFMADLAFRDDAIRDFLPTVDTVILDEAHQLPSVAADFFGTSLSLAQLLEAGRDARALGLARAPDGASWITLTSQFERAVRDLRLALGAVGLIAGSRTSLDRIERRSDLRPAFDALDEASVELARALEINRGRDAELDLLIGRVAELRRNLAEWTGAVALNRDEDSDAAADESFEGDAPSVRWISLSTYGAQFNQTPLASGQALARAREAQPQSWILTSATLTAAGRFDHYLAEVGLDNATTARWDSPFDFPRQALLYLPQSLPSPYDANFAHSVAEVAWPLIRANGGRAFVLCTTLRAVEKVAARLRQLMAQDDEQLPLLVQGASTRRALIDAFRSAGNAVLIGSISFWEGIDIRGDALSLVVIDKLPFAPPDDPVVEAKIRYLRKIGRNPFNEYQLPEAIMLMKQGAGRLIRDETDRGVLMILDERVLSKPYGKAVLSSLPPFARTRNEGDAIEFLTRRGAR